MTKPAGALGRLESLAERLAAIQGRALPRVERAVIVVAAASHGVAEEGVSAFPASVTAQMVANFLAGGAAISVLARQQGAELMVVDAGVAGDLPNHPELRRLAVRAGTGNFARERALEPEQAAALVARGVEFARELARDGFDVIALGEMGIGNTTAASALAAAVIGLDAKQAAGRGTGLDDHGLKRKVAVLERALALHLPGPGEPGLDGIELLSRLGGAEIAFLAGLAVGAAAERVPVLLDGFITGAAALVADRLVPGVRPFLIAGHRSAEPAHRALLEHLGLEPILELGLRLGEGTGAALALPILRAACRTLAEMATFDEAGVSERDGR